MSRALIVIRGEPDRTRAADWVARAPQGTRIEFKGPKRSLEQNNLMWSLLTQVATQRRYHNMRLTTDQWKIRFLAAAKIEGVQWLPALNENDDPIPYFSSSDLGKEEMSHLIEFIFAWGAENNIQFREHDNG